MIFLTPLGVGIYLMIRPGKTLFEKYYHEIDENLEMFHAFMEVKTHEENGIEDQEHKKKKKKQGKKKKKK